MESIPRLSENRKKGLLLAGSITLATLVPSVIGEISDLYRSQTANSINFCLHTSNVDPCEILTSSNIRSNLEESGCTCGSDDIRALKDGVNLACKTKSEILKIPSFLPQTKCGPITIIPRINL